jgi:hypothetical protein
MTAEEHLRTICGAKDFEISSLRGAVDMLQEKIKELEAKLPKPEAEKANGKSVDTKVSSLRP